MSENKDARELALEALKRIEILRSAVLGGMSDYAQGRDTFVENFRAAIKSFGLADTDPSAHHLTIETQRERNQKNGGG